MQPDDEVCLCFHVSLRKIRSFLQRENPPVASLISECLSAGTGCMWCVPFLKHLHKLHQEGIEPDLRVSPEEYMRTRTAYRASNVRDQDVLRRATTQSSLQTATPTPTPDAPPQPPRPPNPPVSA